MGGKWVEVKDTGRDAERTLQDGGQGFHTEGREAPSRLFCIDARFGGEEKFFSASQRLTTRSSARADGSGPTLRFTVKKADLNGRLGPDEGGVRAVAWQSPDKSRPVWHAPSRQVRGRERDWYG